MSEHYYSKKPTARHRPHTTRETLRGRTLTFQTDAGVFSKQGVDFGSRLLIETMELPPGAKVLDVGCGYGPIGLAAAAALPDGEVTMIDVNERAVQLAEENARANGLRNVTVLQSDLFERVRGRQYDAIVTNPPIRAGKNVVHAIFEQAAECLVPGGHLWVVIQKKQGSPSAFAKLEQLFEKVEEVCKDKGYRIFKATRGKAGNS